MVHELWEISVSLETPAGDLLMRLAAALPPDKSCDITVFGSAPLQIQVDASLLSANVDIFSDAEDLEEYVRQAGLGENQSEFFIQVSSPLNFRTSPRWSERETMVRIQSCNFHFPHPIDILIAKLNRLDEKDVAAFKAVARKTGHPTEQEFIRELQLAVDLFRPAFDEEKGLDFADNYRRLWPVLFAREIDVRREIIIPALDERKKGYGEPPTDYKQELREAARGFQFRASGPARAWN
jgi:hypothetical protein